MIQEELPERNKITLSADAKVESCMIDINRYSKYILLLYVTARILAVQKKHSLKSISRPVTAENIAEAEVFWTRDAQKEIKDDLMLGVNGSGPYRRLTPKVNEDGIFVIGGRAEMG